MYQRTINSLKRELMLLENYPLTYFVYLGNIGFDIESKDENATISWLDKAGQAEIDGSLAVGDRIIEVSCYTNQLTS